MPRNTLIAVVCVSALMAFGYLAFAPDQAPQQTGTEAVQSPVAQPAGKAGIGSEAGLGGGGGRGGGGRCAGGGESRPLLLMRGQETVWKKPSEEVLQLPGTVLIESGRHMGEPALPVAALLGEEDSGRVIEIVPCRNEAVRLMPDEFSTNPAHYYIVRTPRGMLKLMDFSDPRKGGRTMAKNLYAVRLRVLGHEGPRQQVDDADPGH